MMQPRDYENSTFKVYAVDLDTLGNLHHLRHERAVILSQIDPRFNYLTDSTNLWGDDSFSKQNATLIVAQLHDEFVGYIIGYISDNMGIIDEIALDAHKYHKGLGRKLFLSIQQWFNERDIQQIVIKTPRYYAVEQAFWRSLGANEWKNETWETPPEYIWMRL